MKDLNGEPPEASKVSGHDTSQICDVALPTYTRNSCHPRSLGYLSVCRTPTKDSDQSAYPFNTSLSNFMNITDVLFLHLQLSLGV
ncbi:hypothetical protein T265_12213 [Opisthorchis viverrini]|uniref:Uncharacterized protein n=1 Tax=Opisthorchis viverrini TaxID=6198 RepID=A0A074YV31_OPIVI|nr:hypothetical protein T265_12213 [Opisthorchis viverrini]KER18621.1 hypothetical protein T265_12213 [Opisthorchis viverrini]